MELGLYRQQLDDEHFAFAAQAGCTALVIRLVDYFSQGGSNNSKDQPTGDLAGWGRAGEPDALWSEEMLRDIVARAAKHGLRTPPSRTSIQPSGRTCCWPGRDGPNTSRT